MTWLAPVPDDVVVPAGWADAALADPGLDDARVAAVRPVEGGEPFVPVPVPTLVPYDRLPLPARDGLVVRAGVARRLLAAHRSLPDPFGLVVLDGWRSPAFQRALLAHYRATVPGLGQGFVADAADGPVPPHTTGGAVDLTLTWRGVPLALGTDYDAFTDDARPAALERDGADARARDLRRVLAAALAPHGFVVHPLEWWHWSWGEQWWAAASGHAECPYDAVEAPQGAD